MVRWRDREEVRHRRLDVPYPAHALFGLIPHLARFVLRMSSSPFDPH
jgi:hypothetical protein